MEILGVPRQIGHRNIRQQTCGDRINLRNRIVWKLRAGGGIENLHRLPGICAGSVSGLGEISLALEQRRDGSKLIKRIFTAFSVVVDEKESLVSSVVDLRNVQRPSDGPAKVVLFVGGFDGRLSGQRVWSGIQGRVADPVINRAMGFIDVEAASAEK